MNKYTYTNHKDNSAITVEADSIIDADVEYQKQTGVDVRKVPTIGCSVVFAK